MHLHDSKFDKETEPPKDKWYTFLKIWHVVGIIVTLVGLVEIFWIETRPSNILGRSQLKALPSYEDYDCRYTALPFVIDTTCLLGADPEINSIDSMLGFYAAQMEAMGWRKIENSLHEEMKEETNRHYYTHKTSSETSTRCQMEIAISASQNVYRGGALLPDISVKFEEYLVNCKPLDLGPCYDSFESFQAHPECSTSRTE